MVRLIPMQEAEYQSYLQISIREYAEDMVQSGNWQPAEALERSTQEFAKYLPDGVATKDHYLYEIEDVALGAKVGMIWLARILQGAKPIMFIYDFRVDEAYRRKGYGEQALRAAEERAKALGARHYRAAYVWAQPGSARFVRKAGLRDYQHQHDEEVDRVSAPCS